jgi:hypothetical protein
MVSHGKEMVTSLREESREEETGLVASKSFVLTSISLPNHEDKGELGAIKVLSESNLEERRSSISMNWMQSYLKKMQTEREDLNKQIIDSVYFKKWMELRTSIITVSCGIYKISIKEIDL